MIVRSKAPLRISFAGGGTDVPPYPQERGGVVLSTTIDKYAYCSLTPNRHDAIRVSSLDYDVIADYRSTADLVYNGQLDLVKAAINVMGAPAGLDLFMHTDAPPGSGLGSSSAIVVALVGAFRELLRLPLSTYEIAQRAYHIERVELQIQGGMQDQYAAAFGGINFIEFHPDTVIVNPLRIDPDTLNELEYHLVLCYTGKTRRSARIIERQVASYVGRSEEVVRALDGLKALTIKMKNALLRGHLHEFGALLHEGWTLKTGLDKEITDPQIDELYHVARRHGAIGGKLLGAGGGGHFLFYCEFDKKHVLAEKLEAMGAKIVEFGFDLRGLQTWQANDS